MWSEFNCDLFQVHVIDRNDSNEFQHWQGNESANDDHDDHGQEGDNGQEAPTLEGLRVRGANVEDLIKINIGGHNFDDGYIHSKRNQRSCW